MLVDIRRGRWREGKLPTRLRNVKAACGKPSADSAQLDDQPGDDAGKGECAQEDADDLRPVPFGWHLRGVPVHPVIPSPLRFRSAAMVVAHITTELGWHIGGGTPLHH